MFGDVANPEGTLLSDYFTLTEASHRLPRVDGRRIHPSTVWRWCRKGLYGVSLEYIRVGHKVMVNAEGLNRFFTKLAQADEEAMKEPSLKRPRRRKSRSIRSQQQSQEEAQALLRRAGILI